MRSWLSRLTMDLRANSRGGTSAEPEGDLAAHLRHLRAESAAFQRALSRSDSELRTIRDALDQAVAAVRRQRAELNEARTERERLNRRLSDCERAHAATESTLEEALARLGTPRADESASGDQQVVALSRRRVDESASKE